MNVVFLDYDGVVNTKMWSPDGKKCSYNYPEDNKVNNFQCVQWVSEFCEKYGYSIVVSSSWRIENNYRACLKNGGLREGIAILGKTPYLIGESRSAEITLYLQNHPQITSFLIFDDMDDMGNLNNHFIKCNTSTGFGLNEFTKAEMMHKKLSSPCPAITSEHNCDKTTQT
jgi:hypothetical protein